jgi:hypothetical protein
MGRVYVGIWMKHERRIVVLGDGPARYLDWAGLPLEDPRDWRWDWGAGNPGSPYTAEAILTDYLGRQPAEAEAVWFSQQVIEELAGRESWEIYSGEILRVLARCPLALGQVLAPPPAAEGGGQ